MTSEATTLAPHREEEELWIDFLFTCVRRSQQIYFDLVLIC